MSASAARVLPPIALGQRVPYWRQVLRGIGQCAFQPSELTGVVLLLAAAAFDWRLSVMLAIGVTVGTAAARIAGPRQDWLDDGRYGFNPGLMALSLGAFFAPNTALWVCVAVLAAVVTVITVLASQVLPFPILAVPFIATFWVVYPIAKVIGLQPIPIPQYPDVDVTWLQSVFTALGSSIFAGGVVSGILVLIGIALSNWRHAVVAVMAVLAAHLVANLWNASGGAINAGAVGFNAVICSLAIYATIAADLRLAILGAVAAVLLVPWVASFGLVPLASGFVLVVWLLLTLGWLNPRLSGATPWPRPSLPKIRRPRLTRPGIRRVTAQRERRASDGRTIDLRDEPLQHDEVDLRGLSWVEASH